MNGLKAQYKEKTLEQTSNEAFNKLNPNSKSKDKNSYNYALVVEDLRTGGNFEEGKRHLLYWGKGSTKRIFDHFTLAVFYNYLDDDKVFSGKLERPTTFLYEALAFFMKFPNSYKVGYIKFNNGLTERDALKYEAALIQMEFRAKETFKEKIRIESDGKETFEYEYIRLLNSRQELVNDIENLSPGEINAIIYQAFTRDGGLSNQPVTFLTQEEIENLSGYTTSVKRFKQLELDKDKLKETNKKNELVPFAWVKRMFGSSGEFKISNMPTEVQLLNLLLVQKEKTNGGQIGGGSMLTNFLNPFYEKVGFNDYTKQIHSVSSFQKTTLFLELF